MKPTVLFLGLGLLVFSYGCGEDQHNRYATFDEVVRAGSGPRSWFPSTMPPSATELDEWHNLDTSSVAGQFQLPCPEVPRLQSALTPASVQPRSFVDVDHWPECLRGRVDDATISACGLQAYRDEELTVVVDRRRCAAYFWN